MLGVGFRPSARGCVARRRQCAPVPIKDVASPALDPRGELSARDERIGKRKFANAAGSCDTYVYDGAGARGMLCTAGVEELTSELQEESSANGVRPQGSDAANL